MVELFSDTMLENKDITDLANQKAQIQVMLREPMLVGQEWYVIAASWFKTFKSFVGIESTMHYSDPVHPGPIDNSHILDDESGDMKQGLIESLDFVAVSKAAWYLICTWYGVKENQTPIGRKVINIAISPQIKPKLEVYKIELKLYNNVESDIPSIFYFSRCDTISQIEQVCRKIFRVPSDACVQLRGIFGPNKCYVLDKNKTVQEESLSCDIKIICELIDVNKNNSTSLEPCMGKRSSRIPMVVPGQGVLFKNTSNSSNSTENRSSPCRPGLSGLANLGNTCFMNSIIQCLSNCRPITKYFLDESHKLEINTTNPLGKSGQIANSFADVISTIWSGKHSVTVPRYFKLQLTHFAPQFAGFRQHDAQELLTFLLDGLHEDLNRVKEKPYCLVEEIDPEDDQELARKSWEYFLSRNNSIIIDNFHGMLKSRVVCPDCNKLSVKFDTFSSLSLPLPLRCDNTITMNIRFVPYDQVLKERDVSISVPRTGNIRDIAFELSKATAVRPDCMTIVEVVNSHFHKFFSMDDSIDCVRDGRYIYMYDIPVEMMKDLAWKYTVLPVTLWEVDQSDRHRSPLVNFFGIPFLLVLPRGPITRRSLYGKIRNRMIRSWNGPFKSKLECDYMPTTEEANSTFFDIDNLFIPVLINVFSHENVRNLQFNSQGLFEVPANFEKDFLALKIQRQVRKEYFTDLMILNIENSSRKCSEKSSLENCLNLFTTTERLGENNAWHCPQCNTKKRATKKLDLWKLPNILVLHLKRFLFNETRREKLDVEIEFPLTGLNIDHYVINKEKENLVYDLVGVCNHYGSLTCGHYTAFCKNHYDSKWYCFDDSSVYSVSPESVQTQHAYVLFYQQRPLFNE